MNTMVFRTSVRYRVKFVAATILVVALVFGGCYFIGGVKDFSWLYLVPIAVVYFVLFERNVVTDNALILYLGFLSKNTIEFEHITSISIVKGGFQIGYTRPNGKEEYATFLHIDNWQEMMSVIEKRAKLNVSAAPE